MVRQLLVALGLVSITVLVHAIGTAYLVRRQGDHRSENAMGPGAALFLLRLVAALLLLHVSEVLLWALAYAMLSLFPDFETSLYYSLMSYTTVGYGDVAPLKAWRLLGPLESTVGVLMLGLSTAVIVTAMQRRSAAWRDVERIDSRSS